MFLPLSRPVLVSLTSEEVKIINKYLDDPSLDESAGLIGIDWLLDLLIPEGMGGQILIFRQIQGKR